MRSWWKTFSKNWRKKHRELRIFSELIVPDWIDTIIDTTYHGYNFILVNFKIEKTIIRWRNFEKYQRDQNLNQLSTEFLASWSKSSFVFSVAFTFTVCSCQISETKIAFSNKICSNFQILIDNFVKIDQKSDLFSSIYLPAK